MKIIDTDVAIDHFHGHRATLDYFAQEISSGETLAISVVTIAEITAGMREDELERTERLLELFTILDVNEQIARVAGEDLNRLRRSHHIELGDALIAASAKLHNAQLLTRNLKHYPMTDISVRSPYERGQK